MKINSLFKIFLFFSILAWTGTGMAASPDMGDLLSLWQQMDPQGFSRNTTAVKKLKEKKEKKFKDNIDKAFKKEFEAVFGSKAKPSQVYDGLKAVEALVAGDFATGTKEGGKWVLGIVAPGLNSYIGVLQKTHKLIKAVEKAWVNDLYRTDAYYHAMEIIDRARIAEPPYIPSYLIKFDHKDPASKGLMHLWNEMRRREKAMYWEWKTKDQAHINALTELGYGSLDHISPFGAAWQSRFRSALGKVPTEREVFNHFLYYHMSSVDREQIAVNLSVWYLEPLMRREAKAAEEKFSRAMAKAVGAAASGVDVGDIIARKKSHTGQPLDGPVHDGDILAFEVYPNTTWTADYYIEWEVTGPENAVLGKKKIPSAKDAGAGRFRFQCEGFEPGDYRIRFRMKGKKDNKAYALRQMGFKVEEPDFIVLGEISATLDDFGGEKIDQEVPPGQILAFEVKRKGTWTDKETVEWRVNGEVYKKTAGDDPKSHCLRFDASPLPQGGYEVVVRTVKDNEIERRSAVEFNITGGQVPDVSLAGYLDQIHGPSLPERVQNGQTLAFNAGIAFPDSASPLATVLDWQILDSSGTPLPGAGRQMRTYEAGGEKDYPFKFTLEDFPNGRFQVRLIHYLAEDPEMFIEKRLGFNVFEPVAITGTRISDSPKGRSQLKTLYPDQDAYLIVYYDLASGIEAVDVDLSVTEKSTGKVIADLSQTGRPRKESGKDQRVGLFLDKTHMKTGKTFVFTASLSTPETMARASSGEFSVNNYALDLKVPGTLKTGDFSQNFSIRVPKRFEKPFQVEVSGGTGLVIGHQKGALSGTISGITNAKASARLHVRVVDANGRSAEAGKSIALVPKAPPKPKNPVFPGSIKNLIQNARYFICPDSISVYTQIIDE